MLTPELHLLRPPEKYPHTRLADVLKRRAEAGVKIYIALFKESSFAMYNSSGNSKKFLNNLHPNICAVRHPDHWNSEGVLYWSHHEKLVIIDQVVAFVGGIDLTLGRYDTAAHHITDGKAPFTFIGKDYQNPLIKDLDINLDVEQDLIDRNTTPRMPWHDVHSMVTGGAAVDVARHFIHLWHHIKSQKHSSRERVPYLGGAQQSGPSSNLQATLRTNCHNVREGANELIHTSRTWLSSLSGKSLERCHSDPEHFHGSVHAIAQGQSDKARLQRDQTMPVSSSQGLDVISKCKSSSHSSLNSPGEKGDLPGPVLQPKSFRSSSQLGFRRRPSVEQSGSFYRNRNANNHRSTIHGLETTELDATRRDSVPNNNDETRDRLEPFMEEESEELRIQILRSTSPWSNGMPRETSVYQAYLEAIVNAKDFIYIENQFFVTTTGKDKTHRSNVVENRIGEALVRRIIRAYREGKAFKVYVVMPVMPCFETCDIWSTDGWVCRSVMGLQFESMVKGPNSIVASLSGEVPNWQDYIGFYSLRNGG